MEILEKDPTGRYVRYDDILGKEGLKTTYKAFDDINGIEVEWSQVKINDVLPSSPQQLERMCSEIHLHKSLKHENIIRLYNSWVDDKEMTMNMVTESSSSGSLRQYCQKHKIVGTVKVVKRWARQILQGLHYLHTREPPIMHRNLKCDSLFVNGNNGEVKIGDFGLAMVMHQPKALSVFGTPEFMAPELYEDEYDELVDIYAFGMCILEMATCEYPYSECKNPGQIYKKVISGIKPASLNKVKDPQVKEFIEKCLAPAFMRLPAVELLKDPFLATENYKELSFGSLCLPHLTCKQIESPPQSESQFMDSDKKKLSVGSCTPSTHEAPKFSPLEFHRPTVMNEFRLTGEKIDANTVSLTLHISEYPCGQVSNIDFKFYLDSDTATSIAAEMVQQLDLSTQDATLIAEMIDGFMLKLVPTWNTSSESTLCEVETHQCFLQSNRNGETSQLVDSAECNLTTAFDASTERSLESSELNTDDLSSDSGMLDDGISKSSIPARNPEFSCPGGLLEKESLSRICSLSIADKTDELKLELEAIDSHYNECFQAVMRKREGALENATKRWLAKKISDLR